MKISQYQVITSGVPYQIVTFVQPAAFALFLNASALTLALTEACKMARVFANARLVLSDHPTPVPEWIVTDCEHVSAELKAHKKSITTNEQVPVFIIRRIFSLSFQEKQLSMNLALLVAQVKK